jgi:hypothetical protein
VGTRQTDSWGVLRANHGMLVQPQMQHRVAGVSTPFPAAWLHDERMTGRDCDEPGHCQAVAPVDGEGALSPDSVGKIHVVPHAPRTAA